MPESSKARGVSGVRVAVGVPFVARLPDPLLFDQQAWSRSLTRALAGSSADLASATAQGLLELREQLAIYLGRHRGIACSADSLIITLGIRDSLDLLARVLLKPGDITAFEDPGYPPAAVLFEQAGAQLRPLAVDAEGLCTEAIDQLDARLLYLTPAHQAPTGATLPVSRRLAVLQWAERSQGWIIEDDYDSEFNYHSAPLPALKALDRQDRVVYCGSFNKTLFAGLRIGYMIAPAALHPVLLRQIEATGRGAGVTGQLAVAEMLGSGAFLRHLRVARHAYQERRDVLLAVLNEHAAGCFRVRGEHAGLHCLLELPAGLNDVSVCEQAARLGLQLQPLSGFCRELRPGPALVIGYAALSLAQVRFAARQLAQVLERAVQECQGQHTLLEPGRLRLNQPDPVVQSSSGVVDVLLAFGKRDQ